MQKKLSANRMNLMKLRRRLKFALRGHKLLKDKQEQLVKEFNNVINTLLSLRDLIELELKQIYDKLVVIYSNYPNELIETWFNLSSKKLESELFIQRQNKLNVSFYFFLLKERNILKDNSLVSTDPYFNEVRIKLINLLPKLLQLATFENFCRLLAMEIQTTRRRVNALEYVLIPQLRSNIRFIVERLNELERMNLTQLMRIKQLSS